MQLLMLAYKAATRSSSLIQVYALPWLLHSGNEVFALCFHHSSLRLDGFLLWALCGGMSYPTPICCISLWLKLGLKTKLLGGYSRCYNCLKDTYMYMNFS